MDAPTESTAPTRRRRWRRRLGWAIVGTTLTLALSICSSNATPPAAVADPTQVHLLYDNLHRGLLFPTDDGRFIEFGYGEWRWYAHEANRWHDAPRAMLWPTTGTLGRRVWRARDADALRERLHWMRIVDLTVERELVDALQGRLEARHASGRDDEYLNVGWNMRFVPDDDVYWAFNNCNDSVAAWLRELGCTVGWWAPIRTDIHITEES